jgi:hypothetical protein
MDVIGTDFAPQSGAKINFKLFMSGESRYAAEYGQSGTASLCAFLGATANCRPNLTDY